MTEEAFLFPLAGSARTVHGFLRTHPEEWYTIDEIANATGLKPESVRTALTAVLLDLRIVRGKRPQENGRNRDEYAFLPFLPLLRKRPGREAQGRQGNISTEAP